MHILATGLKAGTVDAALGTRTLVRGPNRIGKSSIADALVWALLGYVPRLGRTDAQTAQLMRGAEMAVSVTLDGGRTIRRTLTRTPQGRFRGTVECSWLGRAKAKDEEHDTAILRLVGTESADAAEACDVRELLRLPAPQRATRLQALLETRADTNTIASEIARYTMQRLTRVDDARMPENYLDLRPLIAGYDAGGEHRGEYAALRELAIQLKAKLNEVGLVGAAKWANDQKLEASRGLRPAQQAKERLETRLAELGRDRSEDLADLQARRRDLDQEIGAGGARRRIRSEAARELSAAQAAHAAAVAAREEYEAHGVPELDSARRQLAIIERESVVVQLPPAPNESQAADLETQALDLMRQAAGLVIEPTPDTTVLAGRVAELERQLRAATSSPWSRVRELSVEIGTLVERGAKGRSHLRDDVLGRCAELAELAEAAGGRSPAELTAALGEARDAFDRASEAARVAGDAAQAVRAERHRLETEAEGLRQRAVALREHIRSEYRAEIARGEAARTTVAREIEALRNTIRALETRDQLSEAAVRAAIATLISAEQRARTAAGDRPEATGDPEDLQAELAEVQAQIDAIEAAVTTRREFGRLVAEIDSLTARETVCRALEYALGRVRDEQVAAAAAPLIDRMRAVLAGAGLAEVPWVEGGDLGWTTPAGDRVAVAAMSGAEYVTYLAALSAAIQGLRGAPLRLLIVEASECDVHTLSRLLRGLSAAGDDLTHALVVTHLPGPDVAGWTVVDLDERGATEERAA